MKKVLSMMLILAMVLSMLPVTTFAADTANISFSTDFNESLEMGQTFEVTASLSNNPTFGTMTLTMDWNPDVVRFAGFKMNGRAMQSDVFDTASGYTGPNQSEYWQVSGH